VETAFIFEGSRSYLRVNFVIISAITWFLSFNCELGDSKLLHGIRNFHYILNNAGRPKLKTYVRTRQCGFARTFAVFHCVFC